VEDTHQQQVVQVVRAAVVTQVLQHLQVHQILVVAAVEQILRQEVVVMEVLAVREL